MNLNVGNCLSVPKCGSEGLLLLFPPLLCEEPGFRKRVPGTSFEQLYQENVSRCPCVCCNILFLKNSLNPVISKLDFILIHKMMKKLF